MLETGTNLAGYRIDGIVGQGGMGVVYEATQLSLNRTIALKLLAAHLSDDITFRERFRREGHIQAAIDHPNIITVYEAGETEHGLFLAMRLVRGPNLKDMIVARELDAGRTIRILRPVADALESAHGAGLIHRDIKPQNILVGARDHPWLADFGLTKGPTEKSLTKTGQFVGTLDYIAPEQIQGKRATVRSDVYSFTAVMYECLTGIVPFPRESEAAVLYAHLSDDAPFVTDQRPELPAGLDQVIARGMAKDPEERFGSALELIDEAERSFTRRLRAAMTPPGPIETPQETGIREAEASVDTREARVAPAAETSVSPAEETRQAAAPTGSGPIAPIEETDVAPEETRAAPEETHVAPAEHTRAAQTAAAAQPQTAEETRAALAAETREARPSEIHRAGPTRAESRPSGAVAAPVPARPAPKRFRLTRAIAIGAGAVLVVVAIVGYAIGHSGGDGETSTNAASLPNSASAGSLGLGFPGGWQRTEGNPRIPGLSFQDPIELGRGEGDGERLTAGQVDASGPTLLPASFVRRLPDGKAPAHDDAVMLGELEAYRYANLRPRGLDRSVTLYVAPTTRGVATVACMSAAGAAGDFSPACERVASSLELTSGRSYDVGPDDEYAKQVDGTIEDLNSRVKQDKGRLDEARTPAGQAKLSAGLAGAYAAAARKLGRLDVSPEGRDAHVAIVGSLKKVATAYERVSTAARRDRRSAYNRARAEVRRRERAVERALGGLRALGYKV